MATIQCHKKHVLKCWLLDSVVRGVVPKQFAIHRDSQAWLEDIFGVEAFNQTAHVGLSFHKSSKGVCTSLSLAHGERVAG